MLDTHRSGAPECAVDQPRRPSSPHPPACARRHAEVHGRTVDARRLADGTRERVSISSTCAATHTIRPPRPVLQPRASAHGCARSADLAPNGSVRVQHFPRRGHRGDSTPRTVPENKECETRMSCGKAAGRPVRPGWVSQTSYLVECYDCGAKVHDESLATHEVQPQDTIDGGAGWQGVTEQTKVAV